MGYGYTSCMLGRAPQTKETLPDFVCENMDPDKWDTIVWYRVTRNPQEFCRLTGFQWDPWIWGVTLTHVSLVFLLLTVIVSDEHFRLLHEEVLRSSATSAQPPVSHEGRGPRYVHEGPS